MAMIKLTIFAVLLLTKLGESKFVDSFSDFVPNLDEKLPHQFSDYPDYGLDIFGFLKKYEYPLEVHYVTTEDGYILGVHRISRSKNNTRPPLSVHNKPPIILQHGLMSCSIDFINRGPEQSIGLLLADAGWDVWMTNTRGNTFSRNHTTLNPNKDVEFWDFSWEKSGYYDLAANIDYILKKTGHKKVAYIGHSQGTTQFFAMAAMRPDYNDKVSVMIALAPVAYMGHMSSPLLKLMAREINILETLLVDLLHQNELLPANNITTQISKIICDPNSKFGDICALMLFLLCGFNNKQLDRAFVPYLAFNDPAGISSKMIIHYGQEINSGYFRRYDYGEAGNLRKYKMTTPPVFNLSAITTPVALYHSQNDLMAAIKDVDRLASELPNVVKKHLMEDKYFSHLDFVWAKDVATLINNDIVTFLANYTGAGDNGGSGSARTYGSLHLLISVVFCAMFTTVNLI